MKRQLFIALIILLITPVLSAQNDKGASDKGRQRWFKEMRQYKHDFLVKELDMTQEPAGPGFSRSTTKWKARSTPSTSRPGSSNATS